MWIEAKNGGGGVTPTPITPSDSSPVAMIGGVAYEPSRDGYAIRSYANRTPSESGNYVPSGMGKITAAGYFYTSKQGYAEAGRDLTSGQTHTINGLTDGRKYFAFVFQYSSGTSLAYDRFDTATCTTGETLTKICNLLSSNAVVSGTFFVFNATGTSVTISTASGSKNSRVIIFGGDES